jgi:hypothetical protein
MKSLGLVLLAASMMTLVAACTRPAPDPGGMDDGAGGAASSAVTFQEDVDFLRQHGEVELLEGDGGARVAISPTYQGRVMTSGVAPGGRSFGWVNRSFIEAGERGTPFDNFGGEDRFWLGPEGGQYGLYFAPGSDFNLDNWQVPPAINEGAWDVEEQTDESITFERSMEVSNYQGRTFELDVRRTVEMLGEADVREHFGIAPPQSVDWVGFESINEVTNAGSQSWSREGGRPSIWVLGQFESFQGAARIVVPYDEGGGGTIVNADYFQDLDESRLVADEGIIVYKADGKYRSKIGVGPARAQERFGSYNPEARTLTLIQYDKPAGASEYVNSVWAQQDEPYGGDVINAYNDGPTDAGGSSFHELESSSPALDLAPGESYMHPQRTLHLVGPPEALSYLMEEALGVSADEVQRAL